MAGELIAVDITSMPDLVRLAEEVQQTRTPRLLRRNGTDIALLVPAGPARTRRAPLTLVDTSALPPVPQQTIEELVRSRPGPVPRAFTDEEIETILDEERAERWRAKQI